MKLIKYFILTIISLLSINCNKKKLALPQVKSVKITELQDHSPIYIFYDQTNQQAKLNRTNLITSTHWIFHIDKHNSLFQAATEIDKMQTRKANPMNPHNNPNSHNYFSVAEMTHKQLGFIDFTSTRFLSEANFEKSDKKDVIYVQKNSFSINQKNITLEELSQKKEINYFWIFDGGMSFQEFITIYQDLSNMGIIPTQIFYKKP